jgi:hypothetical protein
MSKDHCFLCSVFFFFCVCSGDQQLSFFFSILVNSEHLLYPCSGNSQPNARLLSQSLKLCVVVHAYNPSTEEAEAEGS